MKKKMTWETPRIYALDQDLIQSGSVSRWSYETGDVYINGNGAGPYNPGVANNVDGPVNYTVNGTGCRSANPGPNSYLRILDIQAGPVFNDNGNGRTDFARNYIESSFAVSCP